MLPKEPRRLYWMGRHQGRDGAVYRDWELATVTDEMVERACAAFVPEWPNIPSDELHEWREDLRLSLKAVFRGD